MYRFYVLQREAELEALDEDAVCLDLGRQLGHVPPLYNVALVLVRVEAEHGLRPLLQPLQGSSLSRLLSL